MRTSLLARIERLERLERQVQEPLYFILANQALISIGVRRGRFALTSQGIAPRIVAISLSRPA